VLQKNYELETEYANGCSRSPKVVDFSTNRKCVYSFLLVINRNIGPILLALF